MRYYRDVDYFLYFRELPFDWIGYIKILPDGTACIHINSGASKERQVRAIKHELRHLAFNHMWAEDKPIEEIEDEADNGKGVKFGPNYAWVELQKEPLPAGVYRVGEAPPGVKTIPYYRSADEFFRALMAEPKYKAIYESILEGETHMESP